MNITLQDNELDVYEDGKDQMDSGGLFNYCKTLAGHTITINVNEYDFKPIEDMNGVFVLKRKNNID